MQNKRKEKETKKKKLSSRNKHNKLAAGEIGCPSSIVKIRRDEELRTTRCDHNGGFGGEIFNCHYG
jgi:hypothetical protein